MTDSSGAKAAPAHATAAIPAIRVKGTAWRRRMEASSKIPRLHRREHLCAEGLSAPLRVLDRNRKTGERGFLVPMTPPSTTLSGFGRGTLGTCPFDADSDGWLKEPVSLPSVRQPASH